MRIVQIILLMGIVVLLISCSSKIYIPSSQELITAQKLWPEADSTYLAIGHRLYENKCSSCHYLYRPDKYTANQWKSLLPEMREKAKLSYEDYKKIKVYIIARSKSE